MKIVFAMTNYAKKYASTIWISFLCRSFECSGTFKSFAVCWLGLLSYCAPSLTPKHQVWLTRVENALYYLIVNGDTIFTSPSPSLSKARACITAGSRRRSEARNAWRNSGISPCLHSVRLTLSGSIPRRQGSGPGSAYDVLFRCVLCAAHHLFSTGVKVYVA